MRNPESQGDGRKKLRDIYKIYDEKRPPLEKPKKPRESSLKRLPLLEQERARTEYKEAKTAYEKKRAERRRSDRKSGMGGITSAAHQANLNALFGLNPTTTFHTMRVPTGARGALHPEYQAGIDAIAAHLKRWPQLLFGVQSKIEEDIGKGSIPGTLQAETEEELPKILGETREVGTPIKTEGSLEERLVKVNAARRRWEKTADLYRRRRLQYTTDGVVVQEDGGEKDIPDDTAYDLLKEAFMTYMNTLYQNGFQEEGSELYEAMKYGLLSLPYEERAASPITEKEARKLEQRELVQEKKDAALIKKHPSLTRKQFEESVRKEARIRLSFLGGFLALVGTGLTAYHTLNTSNRQESGQSMIEETDSIVESVVHIPFNESLAPKVDRDISNEHSVEPVSFSPPTVTEQEIRKIQEEREREDQGHIAAVMEEDGVGGPSLP